MHGAMYNRIIRDGQSKCDQDYAVCLYIYEYFKEYMKEY